MANSANIDWLGICLDMMSEYFPVEVSTQVESKRYWEVNEHLKHILELSGLTHKPGTTERADYLNGFMKDLIRIFNEKVAESADSEIDDENNYDNAVLNNLLLYTLLANSRESESAGGGNLEHKLAKNLL